MQDLDGQHRRGQGGEREDQRDAQWLAAREQEQHGQADAERQDLQHPVRRAGLPLEHEAVQEHRQAVRRGGAQPHVGVALAGLEAEPDRLRRLPELRLDERGLVGRPAHVQGDGASRARIASAPAWPAGRSREVHQGQARDGEGIAGAARPATPQAHLAPVGVAVDHDLRIERHPRREETRHHDGERRQQQRGARKLHRQG